jgi:urea carboxylase
MRHLQPLFFPAGDTFFEVVLGDEMSFELNLRVHSFASAIRDARVDGVIELVPELASLLVSFDPERISYIDAVKELLDIFRATGASETGNLESRLFHVPALYYDPWTQACVDEYRKDHPEKLQDPELLCESNGLADRAELQRVHSSTEYWVAALGFWPGLCSLMPLDPRARLSAPKYNPPRSWTPKGTIGLGGGLTCIYPDRTPGGYQIFARSPMPTWEREQRLAAFVDSPALFRPGDRVRFVSIDQAEFNAIEAQVKDGSYQHPMVDSSGFSVTRYRDWLHSIEHEAGHA